MIEPAGTNLLFAPEDLVVGAEISALPLALIEERISRRWWKDDCLKARFRPRPIDLDWNWEDVEIERDGRILDSIKIGIATGDDEVQGAMLLSTEPVESSGRQALFVELLFTAPRNAGTCEGTVRTFLWVSERCSWRGLRGTAGSRGRGAD
jgi:hypothetical protein